MRRAKKKSIEAHRVKLLTPTSPIDVLIGDEEQAGKKEERTKKETGTWPSTHVSYDPQGSYGESILLPPPAIPKGGLYIHIIIIIIKEQPQQAALTGTKDRNTRKSRSEEKVEIWNQGDRPPVAEENPGSRYLQRLGGQVRPRAHY